MDPPVNLGLRLRGNSSVGASLTTVTGRGIDAETSQFNVGDLFVQPLWLGLRCGTKSAVGLPWRQIRTFSPFLSTSASSAESFVFASWMVTIFMSLSPLLI